MTRQVCPLAVNDARIRMINVARREDRGVLIDVIDVFLSNNAARQDAVSVLYHKFRMNSRDVQVSMWQIKHN